MIKVAVTGAAGRMGKLIVSNVAEKNGLELVQAFDIIETGRDAGEVAGIGNLGVEISSASDIGKISADVLIDFTNANSVIKNVTTAANKGVAIIIGTTGLNEKQKEEVKKISKIVPVIHSPNFSVGVNVFWKILEYSARFLPNSDIEIIEKHHKFKKDAPSGTAIKAAEVISKALEKQKIKKNIVFERSGERKEEEISVLAIRGGDIVGEHTTYFIGMGERIEVSHIASSRQAFAGGAVMAASWIVGKEPGMYSMDDVLGF